MQQEKIEEKKARIITANRKKQKDLDARNEREDARLQESLLSDELIKDSQELNVRVKDLLEKKDETTFIQWEYELDLDMSITKFVNNKVGFKDVNYVPKWLMPLKWEYIRDMKGNLFLREEGLKALDNLSQNFHSNFLIKLNVISAYRSYEYQKWIKERWCSDTLCAKPWYSEHQTGLAIDLWEASSQKRFREDKDLVLYIEWMDKWAADYWFTNSYRKWLYVDWYEIEPWHWRYVWVSLAQILKSYDISFSEYYASPESY